MAENEKNNKKGKTNQKNTSKKNVKSVSKKKDINKEVVEVKEKERIEEVLEGKVKDKKKAKDKEEKKSNLKQARKQLYYNDKSESSELSKLIKIVLIVTAIMIVFYGVTVVVTKKAEEAAEEQNKQAVEIQYDSIMIGSMLNIDGSYYVLIENPDDIRLSEYATLLQTVKANVDAPTIYTADLSSGFNQNFLSDKSNYDADMEKFKVTGTTLVRIRNHKIADVYDSYDEIVKKLEELD